MRKIILIGLILAISTSLLAQNKEYKNVTSAIDTLFYLLHNTNDPAAVACLKIQNKVGSAMFCIDASGNASIDGQIVSSLGSSSDSTNVESQKDTLIAGVPKIISFITPFTNTEYQIVPRHGYDTQGRAVPINITARTLSTFTVVSAFDCYFEWIATSGGYASLSGLGGISLAQLMDSLGYYWSKDEITLEDTTRWGLSGGEGTGIWGGITGVLSNQTDLQNALNGKANSLGADDNYVTDAQKAMLNILAAFGFSIPETGTLLFDGNFAATGEVQAWSDDGTGLPQSLLDALPIATNTSLGIAQFNSADFSVSNGIVTIIAEGIGGGGDTNWGGIGGTLSEQLDLQSALDAKADSLGADDNYVTDLQKSILEVLDGFGFSAPDSSTLLFDGNIAATGEVQAWSDDGTGLPSSLLEALPVATTSSLGIAQFDSNNFVVDNGVVTIIGGGGSMTYPGAGVPVSTGSAWTTSLNAADVLNSYVTPTSLGLVIGTNVLAYRTFGTAANNNTGDFANATQGSYATVAYGWGNHASAGYQAGLVSGVNIKTINSTSLLGSGNIDISGGSMTYPGAGIPLSTGSAWGTSITNNSANWNTSYSWGNWASNFGTTAGKITQGNDSRLSDARTPTPHDHGNITNAGYLGTTANIPLITGAGGIIQAGSFGTGSTNFASGDHNHTGVYAAVNQSMYIGTTAVAINRGSGTLNLAGIGTLGTGNITTTGTITATGEITAYFSDKRLKTFAGEIENPLNKITSLHGINYYINDLGKSFGYKDKGLQVGLYAQEVQAIEPTAVTIAPFDRDKNGNSISGENYLTIKYEKLVPYLVEAIKELKSQVDELKLQIEQLKKK